MSGRRDYPIISIFADEVFPVSRQRGSVTEEIITDTTLKISAHPRIFPKTIEKSLSFAHELIKYFTANLLLHHYQEDVPIFTIFLGVNEEQVDINTRGGYYTKFISYIPPLQNLLDELILLIREDLDIQAHNVEDLIMELESMPRLDIKRDMYEENENTTDIDEDLNWNLARIIRTPFSEVYALYLEEESAGELHIHIGKDISATIVTTIDITEKEKAQLMGYIHETLLEALEEELDAKSAISFYSEAVEDI